MAEHGLGRVADGHQAHEVGEQDLADGVGGLVVHQGGEDEGEEIFSVSRPEP